MKAYALLKVVSFLLILSFPCSAGLSAQTWGDCCPMCTDMTGGQGRQMNIPNKLHTPISAEWVNHFRQVYAMEKLSTAQYEADSSKYGVVGMPYGMIIRQKIKHMTWEDKMFSAYGIPSDSAVLPIKKTTNIQDAYHVGYSLETDLIPCYEWLITNARDKKSRDILDCILLQTRMHAAMFQHAVRMGVMGIGHGMKH